MPLYLADQLCSDFSSFSDRQEVRSIDNQILYLIQLHHNLHHYYYISHLQYSDNHVHSCHQNTPALNKLFLLATSCIFRGLYHPTCRVLTN